MHNFIVYGLGISGISTAKFLQNNNYDIVATDDNLETIKNCSKKFPNLNLKNPSQILFNKDSIISFAPGIPLYFPKSHQILEITKQYNSLLSCDIEIFYKFNKDNNFFIGITGTNGKSTTTALTGFIFKELNLQSEIGGNIGIPCFDLPQNQQNFNYIFETSSYQLDLMNNVAFNISALLNITPDHIDRHGSLENYINSKKRIFQNQTTSDYAIVGFDNHITHKIFKDFQKDEHFKPKLIPISNHQILQDGISIIDKKIFINIFSHNIILNFNPILKGEHNMQNIACALAISCCYLHRNNILNQKNIKKIIKIIEKFTGLKHRMQLVGTHNNINFINDSKATNAESSENAIKSFDNIFWIVGGRAKEGGINILKPYFSKVIKAYLIGESSNEFAKFLRQNNVNFELCDNLKNAFEISLRECKSSDLLNKNILLSPACASFDQWKNFEERGDFFCKLVNENI